MDFKRTDVEVELKATNKTRISDWTGSMLRGAIKGAVAYNKCQSLKFGNCDTCKYEDCLNKKLFDRKNIKSARAEANLVTVSTEDVTDTITDTIKATISLYGEAADTLDELREVLLRGIYMGEPRVRWEAVSFNQTEITFNLPDYEAESSGEKKEKKDRCTITINTPIVSKHMSHNLNPEKFMQICTLRLTSLVNGLGINYMVPFRELIEASKSLTVENNTIEEVILTRKSSTKHRLDKLRAIKGSFDLCGDINTLLPFIEMISNFGVGKETTMGLGKFEVIS